MYGGRSPAFCQRICQQNPHCFFSNGPCRAASHRRKAAAKNKVISINQHVKERTLHSVFPAPVKGLFYYFSKWYTTDTECTKRGMLCKNVNFDTDLLSPFRGVARPVFGVRLFPAGLPEPRTARRDCWPEHYPWALRHGQYCRIHFFQTAALPAIKRCGGAATAWRSRSHECFHTVKHHSFRQ